MPGSSTEPRTAWSASHGWVDRDTVPDNAAPPSGRSTAVVTNGCPPVVTVPGRSQNGRRRNG
ncbi:hypothetical protein GCM10022243_00190 [Saccharothrix violaceirubra]